MFSLPTECGLISLLIRRKSTLTINILTLKILDSSILSLILFKRNLKNFWTQIDRRDGHQQREPCESLLHSCVIVTLDDGTVFRRREDVFLVRSDDQTRDGELVSSQQADFSRIRSYELDTGTTQRHIDASVHLTG